eukprot:Colp12_sorted_trinity150504_noHs@15975
MICISCLLVGLLQASAKMEQLAQKAEETKSSKDKDDASAAAEKTITDGTTDVCMSPIGASVSEMTCPTTITTTSVVVDVSLAEKKLDTGHGLSHFHGHGHAHVPQDANFHKKRFRLLLVILELGIAFHSIFIGISLGVISG